MESRRSVVAYEPMCISSYHLNRRRDTVLLAMELKLKIFVDNLEDVINKEVSLEDDVALFLNVLKYARSKLDNSVGRGLYMIPSNMLLKPLNKVIEGNNNKIVVNTGGAELGKSVYTSKPLVHASKPVVHASEVHTSKVHTSEVHPIASRPRAITRRIHTLDDHQDEVQALILVMSFVLLFVIWW